MGSYTFRTSPDLEKLLKQLAEEKCVAKAEILRRAIMYYAYFDQLAKENDGRGELRSIRVVDEKSQKDVVIV